MPKSDPVNEHTLNVLGTILLASELGGDRDRYDQARNEVCRLPIPSLRDLLEHAQTQRVLRRSLEILRPYLTAPEDASKFLQHKLDRECERSRTLLKMLEKIVHAFQSRGYPVLVMKTLDHWPDTGSDADLLAMGDDDEISKVLESEFGAVRQPQSWGDQLAHKFNFTVPGLGELVEIHIGCLGQTGEQESLAQGVMSRGLEERFVDYVLPVPSQEDKIIIATLQRMYRHFYIRLTDIVNIHRALVQERVNFERLRNLASASSVWPGVATLLTITAACGVRFGGVPVGLPEYVRTGATFGSNRIYIDRKFVRVPIVPEAANLYLRQLADNSRNRNLRAAARLTLLPLLAGAAFLAFRLTGNDKGIW
jgi:hypothetical protein